MSEYFTGITFPQQKVTPSYDAVIRKAILGDGVLTGCEMSYSGYTLTMGAGLMIACGRQFLHTSVQNWAVTGATSGYARLLLTIDTTRASTKEIFDQILDSIEYASSVDGFPELQQTDINQSGTTYQLPICIVSLGAGGITGIVSSAPNVGVSTVLEMTATIPASGWIVHPGNTGGYYQNVSVAGILTTDTKNQVDLDTSGLSTTSADVIVSQKLDAAWGEIYRSRIMSNGTVRFYSYEKPDVDLPFRIIVWR